MGGVTDAKPERPLLRCCCCKAWYRRGEFQCCAPPNGMRSARWLAMTCPMPERGGCGKCPRHCQCPSKAARLGEGPLVELGRQVIAKYPRLVSREPGEED